MRLKWGAAKKPRNHFEYPWEHKMSQIWSCGPVFPTALVDNLETTVDKDDDDDDDTGEEDDEYGLFDNDDDE